MRGPALGRNITVSTASEPFQAFVPMPLQLATVNKSLAHLERIGIVGEITNRQRGRVFSYRRYVEELAAELAAPG